MATYLMMFSFTQQGLEKVRESPDRVDAARTIVQSLGGQVRAFYAVAGAPFDTMFIVDAPDEQEAARMALAVAVRGNVRTSTHRAFSEEEWRAIASGLPRSG